MSLDASIDARDVSVLFPLYHGNSRSLKKMLVARRVRPAGGG